MKENTKRIIDWLTLIPFGYIVVAFLWAWNEPLDKPAPRTFAVLALLEAPLLGASIIWVFIRMDKIKIVHWFTYNIAMKPHRLLIIIIGCTILYIYLKRL
jgi:hypothetical protein